MVGQELKIYDMISFADLGITPVSFMFYLDLIEILVFYSFKSVLLSVQVSYDVGRLCLEVIGLDPIK